MLQILDETLGCHVSWVGMILNLSVGNCLGNCLSQAKPYQKQESSEACSNSTYEDFGSSSTAEIPDVISYMSTLDINDYGSHRYHCALLQPP